MIEYKENRVPDKQYNNMLEHILEHGVELWSPQGFAALTPPPGYLLKFDLSNGFPMLPHRDLYDNNNPRSVFNQALGELFAFLNGAQTQEELESFGCYWWKSWTSKEYMERTGLNLEPGDLGPGSYPGGWTKFPMPNGNHFNQIKGMLEQVRNLPYLRRHFVSPWIPYFVYREVEGVEPQVAVAPCHGWFHVRIYEPINKLCLHHIQRSADTPVGLAANLIQYAALTLMLAQVLGYEPWYLSYSLSDFHMYISDNPEEDQRPAVFKLLNTEPQPFPKVHIDPDVDDLFEFRQKHFTVEEYEPQLERMKIWTPV